MTKQTKTIAKPQKETVENILDNTLLDLNLSDIIAFEYQKPIMTAYPVPVVKNPEKEDTLKVIKDFVVLEKEENTLSIDIVVAFCWWAVTYVVKSLVENICNYLAEDPFRHDIVASPHQEKLAGADSDMDITAGILAC